MSLSTSTYVSPPPPACGRTWSTVRLLFGIALQDAREGALERQPFRVLAKPARGGIPQLRAAVTDAHDRRRELARVDRSRDGAVRSVFHELDGSVVRVLDDDDRHAAGSRFD